MIMKKLIFVVLLCITSLSFANAQKNAVGFRFGGGAEFLYQRDLSTKNFLQFTLAIPNYAVLCTVRLRPGRRHQGPSGTGRAYR